MRYVLLSLLFSFTLLSNDSWSTDLENALSKLKDDPQPIIIDFHAEWCGPCKDMDKKTLKAKKVVQALNKFIKIKIDIDQHQEIVTKYMVSSIPHFVILNRHGETVSELKGFRNSEDFSKWVQASSLQAFSNKKMDELREDEQTLLNNIMAHKEQAIDEFFQYYHNAPEVKKNLLYQKLSKLKPQFLLPALTHKRLNIRLIFSSAIHSRTPIDFDPWAEEEVRLQQITKLKESLQNEK